MSIWFIVVVLADWTIHRISDQCSTSAERLVIFDAVEGIYTGCSG
jgi:hypothetical protein